MAENNETKKNIELGELCKEEKTLIHLIRTKYMYGQIIVKTREGKPYMIEKTTVFNTLN